MENAMNKEIFKDIKGYPNYQISNLGRIWNQKTQRYLKPSPRPDGYFQINLVAVNGKRKKEYVHRLVALTFIPNPDNLPEVNHIDLNRGNNVSSNLEWVSRKENVAKSSLLQPIEVYDLNNNLVGRYSSIRQAARELNLSEANVSACLSPNCAQKTHRGFYFKR